MLYTCPYKHLQIYKHMHTYLQHTGPESSSPGARIPTTSPLSFVFLSSIPSPAQLGTEIKSRSQDTVKIDSRLSIWKFWSRRMTDSEKELDLYQEHRCLHPWGWEHLLIAAIADAENRAALPSRTLESTWESQTCKPQAKAKQCETDTDTAAAWEKGKLDLPWGEEGRSPSQKIFSSFIFRVETEVPKRERSTSFLNPIRDPRRYIVTSWVWGGREKVVLWKWVTWRKLEWRP